jgi:hypothetical protein
MLNKKKCATLSRLQCYIKWLPNYTIHLIFKKSKSINGRSSDPFDTERGVKQGNSMSPSLFIIVMDAIFKICKRRTPRTRIGFWNMQHVYAQSLLFADDIALIADTEEKLQKSMIEWTHEVERKGMELNEKREEKVTLICNVREKCWSGSELREK